MSLLTINPRVSSLKADHYPAASIASLFFPPFFEHTVSAGFPSPGDDCAPCHALIILGVQLLRPG